jgi:hypothetical protein
MVESDVICTTSVTYSIEFWWRIWYSTRESGAYSVQLLLYTLLNFGGEYDTNLYDFYYILY